MYIQKSAQSTHTESPRQTRAPQKTHTIKKSKKPHYFLFRAKTEPARGIYTKYSKKSSDSWSVTADPFCGFTDGFDPQGDIVFPVTFESPGFATEGRRL
jgi:hypothetical protein